jgi:hypothetical protein
VTGFFGAASEIGSAGRRTTFSDGGGSQGAGLKPTAGATLFGSGWVWLVIAQGKQAGLEIVTTSGHDNPIQQGQHPLLVNDVWEHAYYLRYENKRPEYLKNWWSIVNWKDALRRFDNAAASTEIEPADGSLPRHS